MCLAIPGKVLEIEPDSQPVMGRVSFGGIQKRVCLDWIPDVNVGDYVIVHVGFAISKLNEEQALESLKLIQEMDDQMEELLIDEPPDDEDKSAKGEGGTS